MNASLAEVEKEVLAYITEARKLLPGLADEISFVWDKNLIIPGNGTGGTLLEPTLLGIGYDPDFEDKDLLAKNLRATILHECFHSAQGWSDKNPTVIPETLLEDGVLEGAATVFERQYGRTSPLWASYEDDDTMKKWFIEINKQILDPNSESYNTYKFGEVNGVKWMLYKLGTWIIDKVLEGNSDLTIKQLATREPKELIKLAGISLQ
jgi:hypothetical protein